MSKPRHFLEVVDLSSEELTEVLALAEEPNLPPVLAGRGAALLFEKASLRTRNSAEMAVVQLGGHPVTLRGDEIGIDDREPVADVARVLSSYHAVIGARVYRHTTLEQMAAASSVPVINLLSDLAHPCQALADVLTLRQRFGDNLKGCVVAFVGDYNNVARSLALAMAMVGGEIRLACPPGYGPTPEQAELLAMYGATPLVSHRPDEVAPGAHAIYTDVWTSMGQEAEAEQRRQAFEGFTVDDHLMELASPDAVFLHCLPAHRGEEVTDDILDGPNSLVWDEAENRIHAQKAILAWCLKK